MTKFIALIGLLGFSSFAQALVNEEASYPVAVCQNEVTIATVYSMPNQKAAQLVVRSATEINATPMSTVVQTLVLPEAQLFLNATTSLRLLNVDGQLKGVLNMQRNQPGLSLVLDCETFAHIQPEQSALM